MSVQSPAFAKNQHHQHHPSEYLCHSIPQLSIKRAIWKVHYQSSQFCFHQNMLTIFLVTFLTIQNHLILTIKNTSISNRRSSWYWPLAWAALTLETGTAATDMADTVTVGMGAATLSTREEFCSEQVQIFLNHSCYFNKSSS